MLRVAGKVSAFIVAIALVLELALQVGALAVGATGRDPVTGWAGGATRVLALGDSNTYGFYLPDEHSYPAQLEALWNADGDLPRIEVANLGYPGTNSSVLLKSLPGLLETFRPDVVLVMIGANDFWTDIVESGDVRGGWRREVGSWLRRNSRLYRLGYMIRRNFDGLDEMDPGEHGIADSDSIASTRPKALRAALRDTPTESLPEIRIGDRTFELGFLREASGTRGDAVALKRNLRTIVSAISSHGSRPVLLTYPSRQHFYGAANLIIAIVAEQESVPLVDLAAALRARCPDENQCPDLFLPDGHAKQLGNSIAAQRLLDNLRDLDGLRAASR